MKIRWRVLLVMVVMVSASVDGSVGVSGVMECGDGWTLPCKETINQFTRQFQAFPLSVEEGVLLLVG